MDLWHRYVEIDLDEAMRRVEKRHIATGKWFKLSFDSYFGSAALW